MYRCTPCADDGSQQNWSPPPTWLRTPLPLIHTNIERLFQLRFACNFKQHTTRTSNTQTNKQAHHPNPTICSLPQTVCTFKLQMRTSLCTYIISPCPHTLTTTQRSANRSSTQLIPNGMPECSCHDKCRAQQTPFNCKCR